MTSFNNGLKVNVIKGASAEAITSATISCLSSKSIATEKATEASVSASSSSMQASIATAQAVISTTKASEASVSASNSQAYAQDAANLLSALSNVDNTSDLDKPVSNATQTALNLKANLASPTFTGTVSGISKSMVGLANVDNTADSAKVVASAAKLTTARTINGELFDGTADIMVATKKVDMLYSLRTITEAYETVWVSGYHTKNDGAFGSHIFRLKGVKTTETDNGGTVIIATIGGTDYVYELQFDGAVNVKWFGAKGDGVTDDTVAIQGAINYCNTSTISKKIYVPFGAAGIYKITAGLIFSVGGITMEFENNSIVLKKYYGSSLVGKGNAIVVRAAYITLINIGIDGNGSIYDGGGILVLDAPTYFTYSLVITNPRIFNTKKSCIEFSGIQAGSGCTITGGTLLTYNESGISSSGYPAIRKINDADTDACPRTFTDINSSSTPLIDLTGMITTFIKGGQCATILFGGNPDVTNNSFISAKASIVGVRIRDGIKIDGEDHSLSACISHGYAPQYTTYGVLGTPLTYGWEFKSTSKNCSADSSNIVLNKINDKATGLGDICNKYFTVPMPYNLLWKGSITDPTIGNGTISSVYSVSYNKVKVSIYIAMGTTTTFGSGNYTFSLPFQANANLASIGNARVFNSGVNGAEWGMALMRSYGSPSTIEISSLSGDGFSPTVPHTFKANDYVLISFEYTRL